MDVVCPSLRPNVLTPNVTDARLRPLAKHTARIPAHGCRLVLCSMYVQLVNIGVFSSPCAIQTITRASVYKARPQILSSTFLKNNSLTIVRPNFDSCYDERVALTELTKFKVMKTGQRLGPTNATFMMCFVLIRANSYQEKSARLRADGKNHTVTWTTLIAVHTGLYW
jgi:hypothetical protein